MEALFQADVNLRPRSHAKTNKLPSKVSSRKKKEELESDWLSDPWKSSPPFYGSQGDEAQDKILRLTAPLLNMQ